MAVEGNYSEECMAMRLEIEPFLAIGRDHRTPAQKEAIQRWVDTRCAEEYENPALRVNVNRNSSTIQSQYDSISVEPDSLFETLIEEADYPEVLASSTYFYFTQDDSGVSRYLQNGNLHTHISVGLGNPFLRSLDVTDRTVSKQRKEVVKHAPNNNPEWMAKWEKEQREFEGRRILQTEVSRELARMMARATLIGDSELMKTRAAYRRIARSAIAGSIVGLSYVSTGNPPEPLLFFASLPAYSFGYLCLRQGLRQRGVTFDPVERMEQGFANDAVTDQVKRRRLANAVTVKPAKLRAA